jgi:protein-disulfide isomerase
MRRVLFPVAALLILAPALRAQVPRDTTADTTRDTTELAAVRADLARIQTDLITVKGQLAQVLRLLSQRAPQAAAAPNGPVRASVTGAPALGRADAPVTIVEFSDYQCPFCQRFFATTLPALKREYVDAGKVRYVFRDFPLDQLHPQARKAAEAAHCAGEQGKYWEMHDALFGHPGALTPPELAEHARAVGADGARFDECLSSGRHAARVERGLAEGAAAGIQGTPGFVIGRTKAGDVVEGTPVRGAQPVEAFRRIIDRLLAQQ